MRLPQKRPIVRLSEASSTESLYSSSRRVAEIVGDFVGVRGQQLKPVATRINACWTVSNEPNPASPPRRLAEPFEVTTRRENVPSPAVRRWSTTQLQDHNPCRRWPSPPSDTNVAVAMPAATNDSCTEIPLGAANTHRLKQARAGPSPRRSPPHPVVKCTNHVSMSVQSTLWRYL